MFSRWCQLWRRTRVQARVVVYTRANCPLCDEAAEFLDEEQRHRGFQLEYRDIANDAELTRQHGDSIPVVEVNGLVRFRGRINPVLWKRLMRKI